MINMDLIKFERIGDPDRPLPTYKLISGWEHEANRILKRIERIDKKERWTNEDRLKRKNLTTWLNFISHTIDAIREGHIIKYTHFGENAFIVTHVGGKAYYASDF